MRTIYISLLSVLISTSILAVNITWNGLGDGQSWSDTKNWDTNSLPLAGDNVTIVSGANTFVDIAFTINSVSINSNATVTIDNGELLTISGSFSQAVLISSASSLVVDGGLWIDTHGGHGIIVNSGGTLTNNSEIRIFDLIIQAQIGKGIINSGTINNNIGGLIQIDNVPGDIAFENLGTVTNNHTIDIENISNGMGISNENLFINNVSGTVRIDDVATNGIKNNSVFQNNGSIIIDGVVKGFPATTVSGVYHKTNVSGSQFNNTGSLIIRNLINISGVNVRGIDNESLFLNIGGSITITNINSSNFLLDGIRNTGDFQSLSSGEISISNITGTGNAIYNSNEFLNSSGSSIEVAEVKKNISSNNTHGVFNTAGSNFFKNEGKFSIVNVADDAIVNDNIFTNSDSLIIDGFGKIGIDSDVSFTNLSNGYIYIDDGGTSENTVEATVGIRNNQLFSNLGEIVGDSLEICYQGISLVNSGTMEFNGCRTINQNIITNSGEFKMTNAFQGIENEDSLVNLAGGNITIQATATQNNRGVIHNNLDCWLVNHGKILLIGGREGIHNEGSIVNHDSIHIDSCSKIAIGIASSASGIAKDTTLINHSTGIILITNMPALGVEMALEVETEIINDGKIRIINYLAGHPVSQGAIINTGLIRNNGTLTAQNANSSTYFRALWNQSNAELLNNGNIDFSGGNILNENIITNNSQMTVNDNLTLGSFAHGIINQDTFINNGDLFCSDTSALINNNVFINTSSGLVEFSNMVTSFENNGLFQNDGLLESYQSEKGIINNDRIYNNVGSTIMMNGIETHMLENAAGKYFENHGDISGTNVSFNAIVNDGKINHVAGTISLINIGSNAFLNQDTFLIAAGASFNIDKVTGLTNIAVSNGGFWENKGNMTISNCNNTGLANGGIFDNIGSIIFNPNATDTSYYTGLRNVATFTNHAAGEVTVNRIFGTQPAIENLGVFVNQNDVSIETTEYDGLENEGIFHNHDALFIDNVEETGLTNIDSFINYSGALLRIRNLSNTLMKRGIINYQGSTSGDETFINNGKIEIEEVKGGFGNGLVNSGNLINNDSIIISEVLRGFQNSSNLPFVNDGVILMDHVSKYGLENLSPFVNYGSLIIDTSAEDGIYNRDSILNYSIITMTSIGEDAILNQNSSAPHTGYFLNATSGDISLKDVNRGIYSTGLFPSRSDFFNYGKLSISDVDEMAIYLSTLSKLENFATINIENVYAGIYAGFQFFNRAGGYIDITGHYGNGLSDNGIEIINTFINEACAIIKFEGTLYTPFNTEPYIIENNGVLIQYETDNNILVENFSNNGIYSNVLGANTDTFKLTGTGMYIDPIQGTFSCSDLVNNFYYGLANGISGTALFADSLGNTSAGTMNIPSKTLNLNNVNLNLDVFWSDMTVGGCSYYIPIGFANTVVSCNGPCLTNTWTGFAANLDWFTPGNWSEMVVPMICHEVIILNGANCNIPSGMTGVCKLIDVATGANFTVDGVLNVVVN